MINPCKKSTGWVAVRPERNDFVTVEVRGVDIFPTKKAVTDHILFECKDCWNDYLFRSRFLRETDGYSL